MEDRVTRILAVDDDTDILDLIKHVLEPNGFDVITASNGNEGVVKAVAERPDLILLDVMMPEQDGWDTCDVLRATPGLARVLVVFLTNVDLPSSLYQRHGAFETDWDEYIIKPFKPAALLDAVKAMLSKSAGN